MNDIYIHEGKGHYIGSVVIVRANHIQDAEKLIRGWLDRNGLPNEALNVRKGFNKEGEYDRIIFANNGDY